ncbi:MAG: acyltransferase family protein [Methanoregula sp.]|uniref:acyltransferase family protein n=1 Tax=Methanoregula sp. TaxID=2052170 RepID=UPI003C724F2E
MISKKRLPFFDILRIFCIAIIVYAHFNFWYLPTIDGINPNILLFWNRIGFFNYPLNLAAFAVMGMFFVSGAVLEYNYKAIHNCIEYKGFILKRFFRLYPIYWFSLLVSGIILIVFSSVYPLPSDLMIAQAIFGIGYNNLNWIGWFIGAIFSLYLLFPFLSEAFRKYPYISLIACAMIELTYHAVTPESFITRSVPLWNLCEFGLGIFCIQTGFYPKIDSTSIILSKIADFSFYVFLFHIIILQFTNDLHYLFYSFSLFALLDILSNPLFGYIITLCIIVIVSFIAMLIDKRMQKIISNRLQIIFH